MSLSGQGDLYISQSTCQLNNKTALLESHVCPVSRGSERIGADRLNEMLYIISPRCSLSLCHFYGAKQQQNQCRLEKDKTPKGGDLVRKELKLRGTV